MIDRPFEEIVFDADGNPSCREPHDGFLPSCWRAGEIIRSPRSWAENQYNVTHWAEMPRGGHFAALEEPELFVEDLRSFARTLR